VVILYEIDAMPHGIDELALVETLEEKPTLVTEDSGLEQDDVRNGFPRERHQYTFSRNTCSKY
jgi:hypothetical protein